MIPIFLGIGVNLITKLHEKFREFKFVIYVLFLNYFFGKC